MWLGDEALIFVGMRPEDKCPDGWGGCLASWPHCKFCIHFRDTYNDRKEGLQDEVYLLRVHIPVFPPSKKKRKGEEDITFHEIKVNQTFQ